MMNDISFYYKWHRRMIFFLSTLICNSIIVVFSGIAYLCAMLSISEEIFASPAGIFSIILFCIYVLATPVLIVLLIISTIKLSHNIPASAQEQVKLEKRSILQKINWLRSNQKKIPASAVCLLIGSLLSLFFTILGGIIILLSIGGLFYISLFHFGIIMFQIFPYSTISFFQLAHKSVNQKLFNS
ncbi:MAG: hypothetical protein NC089_11050 [Bacteroides sp.]|nr:hypothetical protein [Bacteroides sp.]MCM1550365.1 hypothetical protein [Clostridium sp.]